MEVNRRTGHVWVKRLICAHNCGLVINPDGPRTTLEVNMLHGLSRALHEEVAFDTEKVLSEDWISHPTLGHMDTPAAIDVVFVNGIRTRTGLTAALWAGGGVDQADDRGGWECDL